MAEELSCGEDRVPVKVRNPWGVALLPFITLGIHHLVWCHRINRRAADYGRATGRDLGQNPTAPSSRSSPGRSSLSRRS